MYIEKIKIDKFRVLEDIEIHFQPPGGATADPETGNVVNVIAGVNGCGKTSLLEYVAYHGDFSNVTVNNVVPEAKACFVYLPAQLDLTYSSKNQDSIDYSSVTSMHLGVMSHKLESKGLLSKAEKFIKEFIVGEERKMFEPDPEKRSAASANVFNSLFSSIELNVRLQDLGGWQNANRPFFKNHLAIDITIDKLSDGEKQLYGRVIGLMDFKPENSIILIDEPELCLHPAWQKKIMQIYSRIGKNNQFIVATHSPQIIANTPYQNLIILEKKDNKIVRRHLDRPPIGADVNSILGDFMGVAGEFPEKVVELHRQYREKVEQGFENSIDAEKIRLELLNHESNDSRFMQEMRMLQRLRGRK